MAETTRSGGGTDGEHTRETPARAPLTDIYEVESGLILSIEVPGADEGSVAAVLDKRVLRITARIKPDVPTGYTPSHREFGGGDFERSFTVPETYDEDGISGSVKDGILRLELPRKSARAARTIPVRAA